MIPTSIKQQALHYGQAILWAVAFAVILVYGVVLAYIEVSCIVFLSCLHLKQFLLSLILIGCGFRGIRKELFE